MALRVVLVVTVLLLLAAAGTWGRGLSSPFVADGGIEAGLGSGLLGDRSSRPDGMHLGCVAGRRYAFVVTMRNRSKAPLTLTAARAPDPAPGIIDRVAIQLRLAAPPAQGSLIVSNLRRWSAAPPQPVTIPPGRSAALQSNFLMRHCAALGRKRTLVVGGSFLLTYQTAGRAHRQTVVQRSARIMLTRGPTIRRCTRVPRSARLVAADIPCAVASRAATRCRRLRQRTWGTCSAAGHTWNCTATAPASRPSVETCWLAAKAHWFRVRWTD